ncbi:SseB family protein [Actinomadura logoneensis]|uniref:SseB family protein n=1 Tax=Actinomadura logoneensis TaxID=2293572 RepID=A0A372JLW0_9ACTN|nr:SseB family protein [Actinomadura logoneensis]RFU40975.1 SseB family protein [Actinomadura logoneensis]
MDWSDFADRLAAELPRLPERAFLIVQGPTGLPYTQVLRADRALHAEAVGDAFLPVPLTARQERKLAGHGWNEPDDEERLNWWMRLAPQEAERPRPCGELARAMTGALRDAYGVRSPRDLVYEAGMTGPGGGTPLALPALGIPSTVPEAEAAAVPAGLAGEVETERALTIARERGDQDGYLKLLARATLYLPTPGVDAEGGRHFATAEFGGGTFVLAFTSPEAMDRSLRGQAVHSQTSTVADLVREWPHPDWRLAVNPGLPSASYLDTHLLPKEPPSAPAAPSPAVGAPSKPGPSAPSVQPPVPPAAQSAEARPEANGRHAAGPSRPVAPSPDSARLDPVPALDDRTEPAQAHMMQKVLRPEHVTHYLDGGYDLVAGYVQKLKDVADLTRPEQLVRTLGLDQPGSPFDPGMDAVHVIRWPAVKPALFRRSLEGGDEDETSAAGVPGGQAGEHLPSGGRGYAPSGGRGYAPSGGRGYAPGDGPPVPEYRVDSQRLPHGAEMHRLAREGRPTLVAVYDADLRRWRIRLATARGADKPRTPRPARRAGASGTGSRASASGTARTEARADAPRGRHARGEGGT